MKELRLDIPKKLLPLYSTEKRYIALYGGRGGAKSWAVADFLLVQSYQNKKRVLCTREIQNSLQQSVHKLLSDRIQALGLTGFYEVTDKTIRGANGSEFYFKGLFGNPDSVKSFEGIDLVWCEESQSISRRSLDILIPTVRKEKSQILFTLNPTNPDDPVYTDFVIADRDDTLKIKINIEDNPFAPAVLLDEMAYCKRVDVDRWAHVWQGEPVVHSEAQIFFGKWFIENVTVPADAFIYAGSDFGFSKDSSTLIHCFEKDNCLYIPYEAYGVGVDIDKMPDFYDSVPNARRWPIIADSARPETISYLQKAGFNITGAKKGKGSIEDGIAHIRQYEKIIIDPRCRNTIDEFRMYSYVVDKKTGAISSIPEDKNNHIIDALRYALEGVRQYASVIRYNYDAGHIPVTNSDEYASVTRY